MVIGCVRMDVMVCQRQYREERQNMSDILWIGRAEEHKTTEMSEKSQDLMLAYLRLGIRSAMPVIPAMMLPWEIMTPLGMPVEPLVYMMTAMSEGAGCLRSIATAKAEEQSGDG